MAGKAAGQACQWGLTTICASWLPPGQSTSPRVDIPAMSRPASLHGCQAEDRMLGRQGIMSPVKKTRTGDDGRHEALVVLLRTAVDGFDAVTPREIASAIGSE